MVVDSSKKAFVPGGLLSQRRWWKIKVLSDTSTLLFQNPCGLFITAVDFFNMKIEAGYPKVCRYPIAKI